MRQKDIIIIGFESFWLWLNHTIIKVWRLQVLLVAQVEGLELYLFVEYGPRFKVAWSIEVVRDEVPTRITSV